MVLGNLAPEVTQGRPAGGIGGVGTGDRLEGRGARGVQISEGLQLVPEETEEAL